jgi:hypothetical protein
MIRVPVPTPVGSRAFTRLPGFTLKWQCQKQIRMKLRANIVTNVETAENAILAALEIGFVSKEKTQVSRIANAMIA